MTVRLRIVAFLLYTVLCLVCLVACIGRKPIDAIANVSLTVLLIILIHTGLKGADE